MSSVVLLSLGPACGGAGIPAGAASRESGQSTLMDRTFAGANKCNAKTHERPFIIEWDATDMSSFEAHAADNVVFVRYRGCDLQVLDTCKVDDHKGKYGAYKAVEWTSGSIEKIEIKDEGDLYAKLPLGTASLGGRVHGGEHFHMEYFVSGTRSATRPGVYRDEISGNPGCKGATHFVYAYNLGAFALGSASSIKAEIGGSVWGFGAGGSKESQNSAEKKGGALSTCRGESAREVATCKVPIRLTLREISDEADPAKAEATAPETPAAANLAGKVDAKMQMDDKSRAFYVSAQEHFAARDGKACVAALNRRDKSDRNAENLSTNPKSFIAVLRAQCLMLAGQCDVGKVLMRKTWETQNLYGPEQIDNFVSGAAGQYCQGGPMSPRDQLLAASSELGRGATMKKADVATCSKAWDTVKRLARTVKPKDDEDAAVKAATTIHLQADTAAMCLGRAGDCVAAFNAYREGQEHLLTPGFAKSGSLEALKRVLQPDQLRPTFDNYVPSCKGKEVTTRGSSVR